MVVLAVHVSLWSKLISTTVYLWEKKKEEWEKIVVEGGAHSLMPLARASTAHRPPTNPPTSSLHARKIISNP